ncbi:MAG: AbrB/MazE/SpoVT family DNA-binding domain-containing protein [Spirochaetaceae bacterium]|nr:AbrB/MazE/SpoVT family DNA-binding domain-containing protein [Spirochaetaceae bacterium]
MKPKVPKGRFISTVTIGEKGQIVIPKAAREMFNLEPGDTIVLLADKKRGIALVQNDRMMSLAESVMKETFPDSNDEETNS